MRSWVVLSRRLRNKSGEIYGQKQMRVGYILIAPLINRDGDYYIHRNTESEIGLLTTRDLDEFDSHILYHMEIPSNILHHLRRSYTKFSIVLYII